MKNEIAAFQEEVWDYYRMDGRHDLPWRLPEKSGEFNPYKIMVSEIMLQQTQVARVIPKFLAFVEQFPDVQSLAATTLGDVLAMWSGLGYNRRAKFLWQAAQKLTQDFNGKFPEAISELVSLPGVGKNTAGAILAYSFNTPVPFIETNIRTVFIHHFFADADQVPDSAIHELVAETLETEHPREWYWALMDYGTHLKQVVGNLGRASKHYTKQSKFEGSRRQIRGQIIRTLVQGPQTRAQLEEKCPDSRLSEILAELMEEHLIEKQRNTYKLS